MNFLHKILSATNVYKLLVVGLAHCERHGDSPCIYKYCFYGPDQPILTHADRGKACLILSKSMVSKNFVNLCKFGKEC